ncbi:MAG: OmpA family protein [Deltaproteobacteria bacterium]|nr:OmpA family protein [Deltaproteobacteria bacterium]
MRLRSTLVTLALAIAVTATARAEIPNLSLDLGLSGGGHFALDGWDIREVQGGEWVSPGHTGVLKGRVGFTPWRWLSLELGLGLVPAPADDINVITQYQLDVLAQPFDFDKFTPFVDVGVGYYHNWTADAYGMDADPEFHWGLGVRYLLLDWLALRAEARHIVTDGLNTSLIPGLASNLEVTVGADFFVWMQPKEQDRDNDGILDADDRCPDEAGLATRQGCPVRDRDGDGVEDDADKCPDTAGLADKEGCPEGDQDGDGVQDDADKCPEQAGPAELEGCPPPDQDGDGIPDADDRCSGVAGPKELAGCPDRDGDGVADIDDDCPDAAGAADKKGCPDSDGDGVSDNEDKCPKEAGETAWQGCPPPPEEVVKKFSGALQGIKFKTGSAVIDPSSAPVLDDAAKTLKEFPGVRVAIEGHTDNQGPAAFNRKLSEDRANSVRQYLIDKGVPAEQMEASGYGPDKPVADNKTSAGRAQNRRIEFNILSR